MGRHVAVRKAPPLLALAPLVAGAGTGTAAGAAGAAGATAATTAAGAGLGTTAATTAAGAGLGTKIKQGAKKVADATQQRIGAVGVKDAAQIAQNQANTQAAQSQQTMQNNIQNAKDTAQQAKDQAGIEKAWKFPARMMHPEFKSYRDSIIERAKKAPRQDEDFRQNQHWNERMGHKEGRPQEARYIPNQHFEHEDEVHNITPFQVAYATLQHMKENRLIDEDNHDAVALRELLHTDQPHPDPNQMESGMAHIFSPVMDIRTMRGKSAHAQPFIDPKGAKTQHIYAQDVVKPDDMTLPSQSVGVKEPSTQLRNRKIITDEAQRLHFGNFMTEPINYKNMQTRGLSRHITPKIASQRVAVSSPYVQGGDNTNPLQPMRGEGNLRRQVFNAPVNVRARQKQQEAEEAAQKQAEEDALAQQPITITPFGMPGMYNVLDPAVGPRPKMMSHMEAVAAGYEQHLPVQTSEPMDLAWQMLFKAGIEVHHDEPLPQEFTQDITTLDRQHKMVPTENGTMIDNISPHMLRTIELMAQNHKDDDTFTPKPFKMPTTFH